MSPDDIEELYVRHARRIAGYLLRATGRRRGRRRPDGRDLSLLPCLPASATAPTWGRRPPGCNGEPGQPWQPVFVYGQAPERAARVVITAPDGRRRETRPLEGPPMARGDFYALSVPPGHPGARINWLDKYGEPGSRGIRLMPPITRRR